MKTPRIAPLAALLFVLIAGCSDPAPQSDPAPTDSPAQESSAPQEESGSAPEDSAGSGGEETPSSDETTAALPSGPVTITTGSGDVEFAPTAVYCKVSGGKLRHLIAKTDEQPPLLEVIPGEFAMVKLQQRGAPEKSSSPSGIEYRPEGVTFTDAQIGAVTVAGELACTDIEGD